MFSSVTCSTAHSTAKYSPWPQQHRHNFTCFGCLLKRDCARVCGSSKRQHTHGTAAPSSCLLLWSTSWQGTLSSLGQPRCRGTRRSTGTAAPLLSRRCRQLFWPRSRAPELHSEQRMAQQAAAFGNSAALSEETVPTHQCMQLQSDST